ncbi:MAG: type III effector [Oleiphilus sp.]|nr:MAG: type III effector [Oleiphilus sp.]
MRIDEFLDLVKTQPSNVGFDMVMEVISENYDHTPTGFSNADLENTHEQNQGSCKLFYFAKLHELNEEQTLACFGDYYRKDVLQNPEGTDHQNIRNFIKHGWDGISFNGEALADKLTE